MSESNELMQPKRRSLFSSCKRHLVSSGTFSKRSDGIEWTDSKTLKTYHISLQHLDRYHKKPIEQLHAREFLSSSRVLNYLPSFHAKLQSTRKCNCTEAFKKFHDLSFSFTKALAKNERGIIVICESQVQTVTTEEAKKRFKEICNLLLPGKLPKLTLGDVGEPDAKYLSVQIVDWAVPVDDAPTSPAITFHAPVFADSQTAADNFLKDLSILLRKVGYEYSAQEAIEPNILPYKRPIVILGLLFEAANSTLPPDFRDTSFLYHVSPSKSYKSIRANGLVPSCKSSLTQALILACLQMKS